MSRLRRFSESPRYRALWRTPGTNLFLAGVVGLFVYNLMESLPSRWPGSLLIGFLTATVLLLSAKLLDRRSNRLEVDPAVRRNVEDRLDELERLKRREMVTPEEYAAKRQEILKDL
jgi:hypothetical protein